MSGGPSNVTQTTKPPAWATPYDIGFSQQAANIAQGLPTTIAQLPSSALQQVAPLTQDQLAALQGIGGATGAASALGGGSAGVLGAQLGGQYLNPASDPYLQATYNEAAQGLVNQYQTATAPTLMAQGEIASGGGPGGVAGNSAVQQLQSLNQYNLGQNLNNLATNIYGGAYEQGVQNQLTAAQMVPTAQSSLYAPYNALLQAGGIQQQQQQNVLNTGTQNALAQLQYPWSQLSQGAGILQSLQSSGGSVTGPNPFASKL